MIFVSSTSVGVTKAVRVEREQLLGESLLDACEHFIERNVMEKKPPSFLNVRDRKLVRKCIEEIYGKVDQNKQPCEFDESMTPIFDQLMIKKKVYDDLKKEENPSFTMLTPIKQRRKQRKLSPNTKNYSYHLLRS